MPADHERCDHNESPQTPYGAIIALAFCVGNDTSPSFEDVEPMGVVEVGTWDSQPSSCWSRVAPLPVYHDPACEASRVAGAIEIGAFVGLEESKTGREVRGCCSREMHRCWRGTGEGTAMVGHVLPKHDVISFYP